jgi:prolyl-tRNA synthetase
MMRAGMIKKLGAGIYSWMPMGLKVLRKIEAIVREEMNRAGAVELLMPVVQPAEFWQETGRWSKMGPELMRVKDRHDRDFIIQPTSEEVVTDIARQELRSYKQLPRNLYHIQTKFRDERRPRFGVMRSREFIMKDAYSFDRDHRGRQGQLPEHGQGLPRHLRPFRPALPRGGRRQRSHRRRPVRGVPGDRGHWRGRHRLLPGQRLCGQHGEGRGAGAAGPRPHGCQAADQTATPGKSTCADVAQLLGVPLNTTVKSLVLATDALNARERSSRPQVWLLLLRGDHDMNEIKASGKVPGLDSGFRFATVPEIIEHFGTKPGYLGPIGLKKPVKLVADREVAVMADWICGANEEPTSTSPA